MMKYINNKNTYINNKNIKNSENTESIKEEKHKIKEEKYKTKKTKKNKKLFVVYVYDIKKQLIENDKKNYNTIKKLFYNNLNKLVEKNIIIKTNSKSTILCFAQDYWMVDILFKKFKKWMVVYKIITNEIYEQL